MNGNNYAYIFCADRGKRKEGRENQDKFVRNE